MVVMVLRRARPVEALAVELEAVDLAALRQLGERSVHSCEADGAAGVSQLPIQGLRAHEAGVLGEGFGDSIPLPGASLHAATGFVDTRRPLAPLRSRCHPMRRQTR